MDKLVQDLECWQGKGLPNRLSLTGLGGCTVTLGLKQHPTIEGVAAVGNLGQCANARSSNALEMMTVQEIVKSYNKYTRHCQTTFII